MGSRRVGQGSYAQLESNDAIVSRLAQQDKVPWYSKPNLRFLYLLMFPTCLGVEMTSGFDASMMNGLQAVSSWLEYFDHPRSASLGLMVSAYSLGSVASIPLVPIVVNKIGRRYPILLGGTISIIGSILQGSAFNFAMFIIARFMLGFANVFCIVAASSLIGELSHPKERAFIGALFNATYYIGAVASAGLVFRTFAMTNNWAWRLPSFLQVVPSLLQVSFIWFIPESPRWLVSKGRGNEAHAILVKYHGEGDETSYFVKAEYTQIQQTLEEELKIAQMNGKEVFSTPGMRKRVFITTFLGLFSQWSGTGLIFYFLSPILDNIGIHDNQTKNSINLAKVSWSLVTATGCALISPRYPRRRMYLTCTICLFVVFTAWTIASAEFSLTQSKASAQVVLVLIFLYHPAYSLGFTALTYPFLVELFPFHARARGIAIYQLWSRGASFLCQFMNPIGLDAVGWRWYIVYCVWNAFQVVFVYLTFPETSGRTLEELTYLFEGDQVAFRNDEAEVLLEHRESSEYGIVEDDPTSAVRNE